MCAGCAVIRTAFDRMRAQKIVVDPARVLDEGFAELIRERSDYPVEVDVTRVDSLGASATSRRFEDVICELA